LTIYPLVIGLKHYLISWSTLNDMMLYLVNMCFDLGLAKRDVNHGLIRRNSKVKDSQIIDILDIHKSNIDVSQTNKKRNDAAHRGKLLDSEIDEFQKKSKNLWSKKHSLLMINSSEQITDDEFNMQLRELNKQLANLVAIKHLEYSKHYERTLEMNKDLAKELARIYACRILKNKP
ncbi:Cthe_2314 family HEPN domain-containing protein, partial [Porticoccaceae bacterium]|nr:Cthe_2314 family HEPN domain-containing protein [Porticoccaceae bacterium]